MADTTARAGYDPETIARIRNSITEVGDHVDRARQAAVAALEALQPLVSGPDPDVNASLVYASVVGLAGRLQALIGDQTIASIVAWQRFPHPSDDEQDEEAPR